jgi:tetratricopeptide (TPR) repeat protein
MGHLDASRDSRKDGTMPVTRGAVIVALLWLAAAPAAAMTEEEERAKAHFLAGQSYYDQASYADALKEFNEAYRISKRAPLLYNIARCHEALDQVPEAVAMLERYLHEAPDSADRAAIEARINNLKTRPRKQTTPPAAGAVAPSPPAAVAAPEPSPPSPRPRLWTWVVGGIGVATLAAALGTGVASQLAYNDLDARCTNNHCDPAMVKDAQERVDGGKRLALATDVLWPIGAAAVATAAVLFFVEGRPPRRHARVTPLFAPGAGGLVVASDF